MKGDVEGIQTVHSSSSISTYQVLEGEEETDLIHAFQDTSDSEEVVRVSFEVLETT